MRVVLVICLCGAVLGVFLCNVGVLVQVLLISGGVLFSNFFYEGLFACSLGRPVCVFVQCYFL